MGISSCRDELADVGTRAAFHELERRREMFDGKGLVVLVCIAVEMGAQGVCIVPIALYAFYLYRCHKKMDKWRAQQAAA